MGSHRRHRRSQERGDFALDNDGCASTAPSYLANNDSSATLTGCTTSTTGPTTGYVTVSAKQTVDFVFGKVAGFNNTDVHSTTAAAYGNPKSLGGLRPMGLCLYANPELTAWLNLPAGPTGPSGTIRIIYSKSQPDACGTNVPGNWGSCCLNGGLNTGTKAVDICAVQSDFAPGKCSPS